MLLIEFSLFIFEMILWCIVIIAIDHEKDLITFERKLAKTIKSIFTKKAD